MIVSHRPISGGAGPGARGSTPASPGRRSACRAVVGVLLVALAAPVPCRAAVADLALGRAEATAGRIAELESGGSGSLDAAVLKLRGRLETETERVARLIVWDLERGRDDSLKALLGRRDEVPAAGREAHRLVARDVLPQLRDRLQKGDLPGSIRAGARASLADLEALAWARPAVGPPAMGTPRAPGPARTTGGTGARVLRILRAPPGPSPTGAGAASREPDPVPDPESAGRRSPTVEPLEPRGAVPTLEVEVQGLFAPSLSDEEVRRRIAGPGRFRVVPPGSGESARYHLTLGFGAPQIQSYPRYRPAPFRSYRRFPDRACPPPPGGYGHGYGSGYDLPYVLEGIDHQARVPVELRLTDLASGRVVGERWVEGVATRFDFVPLGYGTGGFFGSPFGYGPGFGSGFGYGGAGHETRWVVDAALDDAFTGRKRGILRLVQDLLPVEALVVSVATGEDPSAIIDAGSRSGIRENDRFLVFDSRTGQEKAILRAARVEGDRTEARIHHREDEDGQTPAVGDRVVSQGY